MKKGKDSNMSEQRIPPSTEAPVKTVTIIPATITTQQAKRKSGLLRVAAYCRVSTDDKEQLASYHNQIEFYTQKINSNPEWTMAGIYADEGITGTSAKKRKEFNKLMAACRRGRVDLVLTKSVSRFARNTLDCLTYVRMLKELGIGVLFEKENINTLKDANETILTLCSALAQSESESMSGNITWSKRKALRDGKVTFHYYRTLGYRRGADGQPEIIPEDARVIRQIYCSYLAGSSLLQICKELMEAGIKNATGGDEWRPATVLSLLKNEKYCGDALLQKTYISDCISKKVKKNNGELPQVYVKDNHPAIVSREMFNWVQEEMARRRSMPKITIKPSKTNFSRFTSQYALSGLLHCGECDTPYRRVTWTSCNHKRVVWRCISRLESGKKLCKHSPTIPEPVLYDAILRGMRLLLANRAELIAGIQDALNAALASSANGDVTSIKFRIEEKNAAMMKLVQFATKSGAAEDYFDAKFAELAAEIAALHAQAEKLEQSDITRDTLHTRFDAMMERLKTEEPDLEAYNDELVRYYIESITVMSKTQINIRFKMGIEIAEKLRYEE